MIKVLFVCLGNICRSPTADAVFNKMVADAGLTDAILVDSAGTGSWHIGYPPDRRATEVAATQGYDLSPLRARQISVEDFDKFDYILAMDGANLSAMLAMCPEQHWHKLSLFLNFAPALEEADVPDPYYGEEEGFHLVLDMVEAASAGLLAQLRQSLQ